MFYLPPLPQAPPKQGLLWTSVNPHNTEIEAWSAAQAQCALVGGLGVLPAQPMMGPYLQRVPPVRPDRKH